MFCLGLVILCMQLIYLGKKVSFFLMCLSGLNCKCCGVGRLKARGLFPLLLDCWVQNGEEKEASRRNK